MSRPHRGAGAHAYTMGLKRERPFIDADAPAVCVAWLTGYDNAKARAAHEGEHEDDEGQADERSPL